MPCNSRAANRGIGIRKLQRKSGHNRAEGTEGKARFCAIHALRRMVWQSGGGSEEASEKGKRGSVQITRSDQWSCGLEAAAEKQALPGGRKHQVTLDCGAHSGGSLEAAAKEVQMSSRKVLVKRGCGIKQKLGENAFRIHTGRSGVTDSVRHRIFKGGHANADGFHGGGGRS